MTSAIILLVAVLALSVFLALPLGHYMYRVVEGHRFWATRFLGPLEKRIYRLTGVPVDDEMGWKRYSLSLLLFNILGVLFMYFIFQAQGALPLNPQHLPGTSIGTAFNSAIAAITTTNWQDYGGETTLSYLSQMLPYTDLNFIGGASGIAIVLAIIRGVVRKNTHLLGNFWVDITRIILYVLIPMSIILALIFIQQGVIQTFGPYVQVHLIAPFQSGGKQITQQMIAMGPVASQASIAVLCNNGEGFFDASFAHPFENPTALTNFLYMIGMILIPIAIVFMFGHMAKAKGTAWALLIAMLVIFVPLALLSEHVDLAGNPLFNTLHVTQAHTAVLAGGGNMEGVEDRFGVAASDLFSSLATTTSSGLADCAYDSLMPLSGGVNLFFMDLGECVIGGVGTGLATMLAFAIFTVFLGGLLVGRTPEFLGKKIESFEIKMASLAILIMPLLVLIGTAIAVSTSAGRAGAFNPGTHGFSEILYAITSPANNNGSAFGGLSSDTTFYNIITGIVMLFGRYWPYLALLALAGSLAGKKTIPVGAGTLTTHTPIFIGLLVGVVILLGALNFFPALALGPIAEQLMPLNTLAH
ncbi:MAG: potassium-transporting ATPase subunit KdpA [Acidithiobacillus sp.]